MVEIETYEEQPRHQPARGPNEPRSVRRGLGAEPFRINWGAIVGGAITALAVMVLLHLLGLALGLSAIDPSEPSSVRASGIFTGVWSIVTSLVALFIGGVVASHGAGALLRPNGAVHGLVMWGLTTILGGVLFISLVSRIVSGAASAATDVAGAAVRGSDEAASALGIDGNAVLAPLNQRLAAEGKPQVSAEQLSAAARDAARRSIQAGRVDRATLTASIAQHTNLSQADADDLARRVEQNLAATFGSSQHMQRDVLKVAEDSSKAFWAAFGGLFLGMLAAVAGGAVGVTFRQRAWAERRGELESEPRFDQPFGPRSRTSY